MSTILLLILKTKIGNVVKTGETAYLRTNGASYYDAMPALWKRMTVDNRRRVVALVDGFVAAAEEGAALRGRVASLETELRPMCTRLPRLATRDGWRPRSMRARALAAAEFEGPRGSEPEAQESPLPSAMPVTPARSQ